MSILNDHINLVNVNVKDLSEILIKSIDNPIKIKYAIINKNFNKDIVIKFFPDIKFKYIEHIDELYVKYIKYKSKYLKLKQQVGGSNISQMKENYKIINEYFLEKDICTIDDISIYNIFFLSDNSGITRGYGGGYLLSGMVESIECIFKLFKICENNNIPDKNINEIGITNYISKYFLNHSNPKLTDNFITFYHDKRCADFLLQDYPLNLMLSSKIPEEDKTNNDVNIMVVEKVTGDLRGFLETKLPKKVDTITPEINKEIIQILDSILFQIVYTLFIFNKEFNGFVHGDLHMGNILIKNEPVLKTKKYKIIRHLDDEDNTNITEYNIEIKTYGITPKIWDFATSFVKNINDKIKEKDEDFITKYFNYKKYNNLIHYSNQIINRDLSFLLRSIISLSTTYYLPEKYIEEITEIFNNTNIERIFNIFLTRINESNQNDSITQDDCDYYLN